MSCLRLRNAIPVIPVRASGPRTIASATPVTGAVQVLTVVRPGALPRFPAEQAITRHAA